MALKPTAAHIWYYDFTRSKFRKIDTDSPRIDWEWSDGRAPLGKVAIYERAPTVRISESSYSRSRRATRWNYCYFALTGEACAESVNRYNVERIASLEAEIEALKSDLVEFNQ